MRAKHTKFNKIATTIVASFGLTASIATGAILVLNNEGVIDMHNATPNTYEAKFYVDNSLVFQTTKNRGEVIGYGYDNFPSKDKDVDGQPYVFVGWDLTGEGIPDILPNRIYGNFSANAVFAKFGIPDIDWTKVDFNKLLDILNALDIDLESFMNFFGLDWEDMLELLDVPVINYGTDYNGIIYLRNESFGDYNKFKHKWENASFYNLSNISSGSVNPMQFSIDKAKRTLGNKAEVTVAMEYLKSGSNYPVMCYELENNQHLNSDSVSLTKPVDNSYLTKGLPYSFITSDMISLLQSMSFSNDAIKQDEIKYREYARENYTKIDEGYKNDILTLLGMSGISYDDNYRFVDKLYTFFKNNYTFDFRMPSYPMTCDPVMYFLTDAKVGLGRHFAAATTLAFRALGVPARYVQGYVDYAESGADNTISAIQAHSWCEIYVNGVGWIAIDTAIQSISGLDLGFLFNTENVDDLDFEAPPDGELVSIKAATKKEEYEIGEEFTEKEVTVTATYSSGDTKEVTPTKVIIGNRNKEGKVPVTAFYHDGDNVCYDTIYVTIAATASVGIAKDIYGKEYSLTSTYNGEYIFNEYELFTLYDSKNKVYEIDEDDTLRWSITFSGKNKGKYTSLNDIKDVGTYAFKINPVITDRYGDDVTYSKYGIEDNKQIYRITIEAVEISLSTESITIDTDELKENYGGILIYPEFTEESLTEAKKALGSGDSLSTDSITGWSSLSGVGVITNTFDVSSIKVYRVDEWGFEEDVTINYVFSIDEEGTLAVTEVAE